jgi:DNA-binding NarL/FixJ family response regulator
MVDDLEPDLVLMDINMGGIDGIEATRRLTGTHPDTAVVLVSTYSASDLPLDVQDCGAMAYLHKEELTGRALRKLWESGGQPGWRARNGST